MLSKALPLIISCGAVLLSFAAAANTIVPHYAQASTEPARTLQRTETTHFENWIVVCDEFAETPKKHFCNAQLRAQQSGNNQIVLVWTLSFNDNKQLVGTLQTLTGVMIAPGVELQIDNAPARKFVYESCEPHRCLATLVLDKDFVREASAASKATVNIRVINGGNVRLEFPIKGFEKAYAQLKANAG